MAFPIAINHVACGGAFLTQTCRSRLHAHDHTAFIVDQVVVEVAQLGSAVALGIFAMVTIGHLRIRSQTGANLGLLILALVTSAIALITFVFTSLLDEPASIVTLILIVVICIVLDLVWSRMRDGQAVA